MRVSLQASVSLISLFSDPLGLFTLCYFYHPKDAKKRLQWIFIENYSVHLPTLTNTVILNPHVQKIVQFLATSKGQQSVQLLNAVTLFLY